MDKNSLEYRKKLLEQFKKMKHYDDGTPSASNDSGSDYDNSVLDSAIGPLTNIGQALTLAFEGPKPSPTPTPDETQQQKYDKIRHQNLVNMGEAQGVPNEYYGGKIKKYDQGGTIQSGTSQPPPGTDKNQSIGDMFGPGDDKVNDAIKKAQSYPGYDDGGEVQQDPSILQKLENYISPSPNPYQNLANTPVDPNQLAQAAQTTGLHDGGKLDTNARKHISEKNFALPGRRYPINDKNHARNALARVSQNGSPKEKAEVKSKVHKKYPDIEMKSEGGKIKPKKEKPHNTKNIKSLKDRLKKFLNEEESEGDHNKNNIEGLKAAFAEFLSEEQREALNKGGKVRHYDEGTPRVEEVQGDEQDISASPIMTGMYTPEDEEQDAENAADMSTGDQIDQAANDLILNDQDQDQSQQDDSQDQDQSSAIGYVDSPQAQDQDTGSGTMPQTSTDLDAASPEDIAKIADVSDLGMKSEDQDAVPASQVGLNPDQIASRQSIMDQLKQAQQQRENYMSAEAGANSGALLAAGIAGHGATPVNPAYFKSLGDLGQLPVQNLAEQIKMQSDDPASPVSQVMKQYLQSKGIKVPDNASANDLMQVAPYLKQDQQLKNAMIKMVYQQQQENERAKASNESREKSASIMGNARIQGYNSMNGTRMTMQDRQLASQFINHIQNDPLIKPSTQNLGSLDKAMNLINNKSVPLTPQILSDAEQDVASGMQIRGLGGSEGKIDRTQLQTIGRTIAQKIQYYGNNPNIDLRKTDPALVNQIQKTVQALRDDYKTTINQRKSELAEQYGKPFSGADTPVLNAAIRQYNTPVNEVSSQDQQALQHYQTMDDSDPNKAVLGNILKSKGLLQ
jgi:hypothetical protein